MSRQIFTSSVDPPRLQRAPAVRAPGLPDRLHLVGVGGAGLSGAARLLLARGHELTGHDREASPFTAALRGLGVPIALAPSRTADLPAGVGAVVRSAAVPDDDPQVLEALRRGLPVLKYSELLGRLAPPRRTLAVAGTHGKTTTTWMLLHALVGLVEAESRHERDLATPGALVGGIDRQFQTNAIPPGVDGWFAVEACEYDRSFLQLSPRAAIVTNLEAEHLDCFDSLEALEVAFARFVDRVHVDGLLVVGSAVPERVFGQAACEVWRVGRELQVELASEQRGCFAFRLRGPGWRTPKVQLGVPGPFNVDNAAAALGLAIGVATREGDLEPNEAAEAAAHALERFEGVARRFEPWGRVGAIDVVHDYAHHPTEVAATLEAARRVYVGRPLHVLFQPHQHSRTARFLGEFVDALRGADRVVVADVYGARRHQDRFAAGAEELVQRLVRAGVEAEQGGPVHEAAAVFAAGLPASCAALVLGAGDVGNIHDELLGNLALRGPA